MSATSDKEPNEEHSLLASEEKIFFSGPYCDRFGGAWILLMVNNNTGRQLRQRGRRIVQRPWNDIARDPHSDSILLHEARLPKLRTPSTPINCRSYQIHPLGSCNLQIGQKVYFLHLLLLLHLPNRDKWWDRIRYRRAIVCDLCLSRLGSILARYTSVCLPFYRDFVPDEN